MMYVRAKKLDIYMSYPMTLATPRDAVLISQVRTVLKGCPERFQVYDPEKDEDKSKPLVEIQDDDFNRLGNSDVLVGIWGPGSPNSKGQCAEFEWAVRCFRQTLFVYNPDSLAYPPWVYATLQNGRTVEAFTLTTLLDKLTTLWQVRR